MTKPSSATGVTFRKLDDLFEPTDGRADLPQLAELEVDSLVPFKDHPFREYPEEKMQEMIESVSEHGVLSPILVRPHKSGEGYEIIAGHNRVEACRRAGIKTIPATIRELDDDTATIVMVDSNLRQRDKLLPSEKAKAYKMKLDALSRKLGRPSKNMGQVVPDFQGKRSTEIVGEQAGDSYKQVQRFIPYSLHIPLNYFLFAVISFVDHRHSKLVYKAIIHLRFRFP